LSPEGPGLKKKWNREETEGEYITRSDIHRGTQDSERCNCGPRNGWEDIKEQAVRKNRMEKVPPRRINRAPS